MISIRGAVTARENTKESILEAVEKLLLKMIAVNNLTREQIIDIIFSATKDLNAVYPAVAARAIGIVEAGLFCVQEMDVPGSLPMCIRILVHAEVEDKPQSDARHVYLEGAVVLRPDLASLNSASLNSASLSSALPTDTHIKDTPINVAIDGPSGAGKSTVAKEVAKASSLMYVDTGAMYRAVALYCINSGINMEDAETDNVQKVVEDNLKDITVDIRYDREKGQRLILNGEDVTEALRTQQVAEASSIVASYKAVRQKLVAIQQDLAKKHSVIMDGRDIGSFVLPNAQVKIYLDASLEERVLRRMDELSKLGGKPEYEKIKKDIEIRDHRDMNRSHAPLVKAKDAIYIKSDGMSVREITERILEEIPTGDLFK